MLEVEGANVRVTQYHEDSEDEELDEEAAMEEEFQFATDTIRVTGISKSVSSDLLKMYFVNKKRSGGGEVVRVDYKKEEGTAVLIFKEIEGKI